ncbi:hypothetical protein Q5752_000742 [Cryptotrichosporon argae]
MHNPPYLGHGYGQPATLPSPAPSTSRSTLSGHRQQHSGSAPADSTRFPPPGLALPRFEHGPMTPMDDHHTAKRPRAATVCESCRKRKLGCSGGTPCARCAADGRECVPAGVPTRSPLTRARMTEIEEKLEASEAMWHAMFPDYEFEQALSDQRTAGIGVVARRARCGAGGTAGRAAAGPDGAAEPVPEAPTGSARGGAAELETDEWNAANDFNEKMYEYGEEQAEQRLDSLGLPADRGVSYLGLSSNATFLNAIRRMCGVPGIPRPHTSRPFDLSPPSGQVTSRLPLKIPPIHVWKPLVDGFFRYFQPMWPLVHEATVRAMLSSMAEPKKGNEVLLHMIFAMGEVELGLGDGRQWYYKARQAFDYMREGTITLVQALGIMSVYLQRNDQTNAGYMCLGIALRMAVALGLHDPTVGQFTPLQQEARKRMCWALVSLEEATSAILGRIHMINTVQVDMVPLPLNVSDEALSPTVDAFPPESDGVTEYTALKTTVKFLKVTCAMHERVLQAPPTFATIQKYDARIADVFDGLPAYARAVADPDAPHRLARAVALWRARDYRALLYRPFLMAAAWVRSKHNRQLRTPATLHAVDCCRRLATENLGEIHHVWVTERTRPLSVEWYMLLYGLQSAMNILACLIYDPLDRFAAELTDIMLRTIRMFRELRFLHSMGESYAQTLELILMCPTITRPPANVAVQHAPTPEDTVGFQEFAVPSQIKFDPDQFYSDFWSGLNDWPVGGDLSFDPTLFS